MGTALIDIKECPKGGKFSIVVFDSQGLHETIVKDYAEVRETVDMIKRKLRSSGYGVEIQNTGW